MRASLPFIGYGGMDSRVKKEEENGDLGSRFARDKDGQSVGSTFRSPDRQYVNTLTNSAPRPHPTADTSAGHDDQGRDPREYGQRFTSSGSVIKKEDDGQKTGRNRAKVEENKSQSLRAVKRERDDGGRNLTGYHGDFKRVRTGAYL
ncbi:hypothetical protein D9757_009727 [Collybiopsis confluens]|uniref:Uncharacterized protein n=1 Tax=Collybiopsis confluens TaxID=2823264 RepID=A0A8H5H626_9AGAR|nr:hypothetical protein D9757_009727 [Collybiopsis confluens]